MGSGYTYLWGAEAPRRFVKVNWEIGFAERERKRGVGGGEEGKGVRWHSIRQEVHKIGVLRLVGRTVQPAGVKNKAEVQNAIWHLVM